MTINALVRPHLGPARFSPEWWGAWTSPEPNTGCHLWLGTVCRLGYGRAWRDGQAGVPVHRIAYEQARGPIAKGLVVCHRCDTPSCVNPDHLFAGTQAANLRDMFAKGRARPRGRGPRATRMVRAESTLARPVAGAETVPESVPSAQVLDVVHLIRSTAVEARWRLVTGVPAKRPTNAIVLWKRPESWTVDKVPHHTGGASAAPYCATQRRGGV